MVGQIAPLADEHGLDAAAQRSRLVERRKPDVDPQLGAAGVDGVGWHVDVVLPCAARRISRVAVYGEPYSPQPSLLVKIKPKKSQDDGMASGDIFPYSMRGALYGVYHFPVDGEYEFRWRYSNNRAAL